MIFKVILSSWTRLSWLYWWKRHCGSFEKNVTDLSFSIINLGLHPALIPNRPIDYVGEAHSSTSFDNYPANCAFGQPCQNGNPWASAHNSNPPHLIWFRFKKPKVLTKIGFSSRSTACWQCQSPKKFEVIAAMHPNVCEDLMMKGRVLLSVEDAGFQEEDQAIAWLIPKKKQLAYRCIGIKIHSVIGRVEQNGACSTDDRLMVASLFKMHMWEKRLWLWLLSFLILSISPIWSLITLFSKLIASYFIQQSFYILQKS